MCLGIPGKVIEIFNETYTEDSTEHAVLMGKVDFGGIQRRVCLEHVPDVKIGEYVVVHVGFALSRIDEIEAKRVFEFLREMDDLSSLETSP